MSITRYGQRRSVRLTLLLSSTACDPPVVGETPIHGFYVANGCSGHGFKLAPAIGSLIAQGITGEKIAGDTAADGTFLSFNREPISLTQQSVLA